MTDPCERFRADFHSLFPQFRRTWTDAQLENDWYPFVRQLSEEQLDQVLDHYKFDFAHGNPGARKSGPTLRHFRNQCWVARTGGGRRRPVPEWDGHMTAENRAELDAVKRALAGCSS